MDAPDHAVDASAIVARLPVTAWVGYAWRFHRQRYAALDPAGSLRTPGRFHRGSAALYVGLGPHVAPAERLRHLDPDDPIQVESLNEFRLTKVRMSLSAVVDCCGRRGGRRSCATSAIPDFGIENLCRDTDFTEDPETTTQAIGAAVRAAGAEGMFVPSCTRFSTGNLILLPDNLRAESVLRVLHSEDPELRVRHRKTP